jgi:hypothetical protein
MPDQNAAAPDQPLRGCAMAAAQGVVLIRRLPGFPTRVIGLRHEAPSRRPLPPATDEPAHGLRDRGTSLPRRRAQD